MKGMPESTVETVEADCMQHTRIKTHSSESRGQEEAACMRVF